MSSSSASLSGMTDVLALLDKLGARGDAIARSAATTAARTLRASYLVDTLSRESGIKHSVVLRNMVANAMGKPLAPKEILFISDLPKTRNGKVMRRMIRSAYLGLELGDTSALVNGDVLEEIKAFSE